MPTDQLHTDTLKAELLGLFEYIQRVRKEIAAIHHPVEEDNQFENMAEQLDAIVKATEEATNTIMEAMERNDQMVARLRKGIKDPKMLRLLDEITNNGIVALEACSFQDITGQRVNKVTKSIAYVEKRVTALISVWGKEELEKIRVEVEEGKTEDQKLLHGPQLEGRGLAQDEIDALFA